MGLASGLASRGCDLYLSGHDHVMQHFCPSARHPGLDTVVAGASIESHYWQGADKSVHADWARVGVVGFLACRVAVDATAGTTSLTVSVIDSRTEHPVYEFTRTKPLKAAAAVAAAAPAGAAAAPAPRKPSKRVK